MKLAEALTQRAGLVQRMDTLKTRLTRNARVQEGDQPGEDPEALLREYEAAVAEFTDLVARINLTNAATAFGDRTLTHALAERDALRARRDTYAALAAAAGVTQTYQTRSEVRFRPTVPVAAIQRVADEAAQALRRLDTRIQEGNWKVDLMD